MASGRRIGHTWGGLIALVFASLGMIIPTSLASPNPLTGAAEHQLPVQMPISSVVPNPSAVAPGPIQSHSPLDRVPPSHNSPPSFSGHYYAGALWWGTPFSVQTISVNITTPNDVAISGDSVYAILSIWDNVASYDQIGISDYGGYWNVAWAHLGVCGTQMTAGQNYSENAARLSQNTPYYFSETIYSNGSIYFYVNYQWDVGVTGPSWSKWAHTGGTYFLADAYYYCDGIYWYDYSDYEEVWNLAQQLEPNWSFIFLGNYAQGSTSGPWSTFTGGSPPSGSTFYASAFGFNNVAVQNQWFSLGTSLCAVGVCTTSIGQGGGGTLHGSVFQTPPSCSCVPSSVSLSTYSLPSGWSAYFGPTSVTPNGTFNLTVRVPSSASCGQYFPIGIEASYGEYTTLRFDVWVTGSGCGGGGGCVAFGTPILTSTGYVRVQNLVSGGSVLEYDLQHGQLVSGMLVSANTSWARSVLDINNGSLVVTLSDQPIYVRNSTFTGWIRDPRNLTLADSILNPLTGSWVPITSLTVNHGWVRVFDVVTTSANDFIANGLLLDVK